MPKSGVKKVIIPTDKTSRFSLHLKRKNNKLEKEIHELKSISLKLTPQIINESSITSKSEIKEIRAQFNSTDLRTYLHVDMDAFYAAVEEKYDPSLKGIPMAVGSKDMLTTANYAARKFGISSAMPGFIALRLCPHLKIVPVRMKLYTDEAISIREIFYQFDKYFQSSSIDEACLDITDHLIVGGDTAWSIADRV